MLADLSYCDTDMECIFTVVSNLVSKAQSPDDALAMADQIANKLTAQPIEKPVVRLKMYIQLLSTFPFIPPECQQTSCEPILEMGQS